MLYSLHYTRRTSQLGHNVTAQAVVDDKRDASPLQLSSLRHHRQPYPTSAVSVECFRHADHADRSAWTHHIRSFCGNCIGCWFNAISSSSWQRWCTRHFM